MKDNKLLNAWNSGNLNQIIQNYDLNSIKNTEEIFFYIDSYIQLEKFTDAETLINQSLLSEIKSNENIVIKNLLLARLNVRLMHLEKVENLLNEIFHIKSNLDEWFIFSGYQLKALNLFIKNNFKDALKILDDLDLKYKNKNETFENLNISYLYSLRGLIKWKIGDKTNALVDMAKAISIDQQYNNKSRLANDYFVHGQIYVELGEFLKALIELENANNLFVELDNQYGKELGLLAKGEIKYLQGKLDEALGIFERSNKIFEGNNHQLCENFILIGRIYLKKDNFERAKSSFQKAIELSTVQNLIYLKSLSLLMMLDLLVEKRRNDEIDDYFKKIPSESDDEIIKLMKLMGEALIKQMNNEIYQSNKIWLLISSDGKLPFQLKIYALENALKTCILLWKEEKELNLLKEIEELIETWEKIATDNFLMSSLATIYLLKAKFFLAVIQVSEAKYFLEEGLKLVEKYGLEIDKEDIANDQEKISKIEQLKSNKAVTENEISLDEMLDYLKNAKTNMLIQK